MIRYAPDEKGVLRMVDNTGALQGEIIYSDNDRTVEADENGDWWLIDHTDGYVDEEGVLHYLRTPYTGTR